MTATLAFWLSFSAKNWWQRCVSKPPKLPGLSVVHHILPMLPLSRLCPMVHTHLAFPRTCGKRHDKWLCLAFVCCIWEMVYKIVPQRRKKNIFYFFTLRREKTSSLEVLPPSHPRLISRNSKLPDIWGKKEATSLRRHWELEGERDADACKLLSPRITQILRWMPWTSVLWSYRPPLVVQEQTRCLGSHFHLVRRNDWGCWGALDPPQSQSCLFLFIKPYSFQ